MTSRLFLEHLEYSMSNKSFKVSVDKYGKVCNFLAVTGFKGTDGGQFDGAHTKHIVTRLITTKLNTTKLLPQNISKHILYSDKTHLFNSNSRQSTENICE